MVFGDGESGSEINGGPEDVPGSGAGTGSEGTGGANDIGIVRTVMDSGMTRLGAGNKSPTESEDSSKLRTRFVKGNIGTSKVSTKGGAITPIPFLKLRIAQKNTFDCTSRELI